MGDPQYCATDHGHADYSRHGVIAGGKEFLLHKLKCGVCGTQVQYNETPTEIAKRKKEEADAERRRRSI